MQDSKVLRNICCGVTRWYAKYWNFETFVAASHGGMQNIGTSKHLLRRHTVVCKILELRNICCGVTRWYAKYWTFETFVAASHGDAAKYWTEKIDTFYCKTQNDGQLGQLLITL